MRPRLNALLLEEHEELLSRESGSLAALVHGRPSCFSETCIQRRARPSNPRRERQHEPLGESAFEIGRRRERLTASWISGSAWESRLAPQRLQCARKTGSRLKCGRGLSDFTACSRLAP